MLARQLLTGGFLFITLINQTAAVVAAMSAGESHDEADDIFAIILIAELFQLLISSTIWQCSIFLSFHENIVQCFLKQCLRLRN